MGLLALAMALLGAACGTTLPASRFASKDQAGARGTAGGEGLSGGQSPNVPASAAGAAQAGSSAGGASAAPPGASPSASVARGSSGAAPSGADHSPIQLGLLYTVNDGAESAGINNGNNFSLKQAVVAFVDSYNATGGIGGRHIDPVYGELHSASNDYESQAQSVCAAFTQDHHVAAVLSNVGYYSQNLLTCLAKAGVPVISGDWAAPDQEDATRYPLFVTPTTPLGDLRVGAVVRHLAAAGFLQSRHRIGVVVEDCPIDQRVYKNSLVPALQGAGLTLASTFQVKCFQSLQDYGAEASDMQNAVLQFRQHLVDRVMVLSQAAEANLVFLFSQSAEAQRYLPGYALSSVAAPTVLALNAPADQLANAQGVGWLPEVDSADHAQAPPTATGRRCLDRMRAAGIQPSTNADYTYVYGTCDSFTLYDTLLSAANGDSGAEAFRRALGNLGQGYVSASTVDGREALSGGGRLGPGEGRLFAYVGGRFVYTSAPFPL